MIRFFLFLFLFAFSVSNAEIRLRFGEHADYTRIVLEAEDEPLYRIFSLPDPARLVVDLRESKVSKSASVKKGLVEKYRVGQFEAGVTRIVIDIRDDFSVKKFFSIEDDGKFRVVIDVERGNSTPDFLRLAKKWESYRAEREDIVAARAPIPPQLKSADKKIALPLIVIDPGHGGVDPGSLGRRGSAEKDVTLGASKQMRDVFEASGRYRVLLTRTKDVYIPLRKRFEIAERAGAELFISVHADSIKSKSLRGASVYTLSETASDKEAEKLAARENASDVNAGAVHSHYDKDVIKVLVDLEQRGTIRESATIANHIVSSLRNDKELRLISNPHRFAGFAVLKSSVVPSILVEMGFMSNESEEKLLRSKKFQRRFSRALLRSVDKYFQHSQL